MLMAIMTLRRRRCPLSRLALLAAACLFAAALLFGSLPAVRCQDDDGGDGDGDSGDGDSGDGDDGQYNDVPALYSNIIYGQLDTLATSFATEIANRLDFCIKDSQKEWNLAFNFSSDLTFVRKCYKETQGDLTRRICTVAEINNYFDGFYHSGGKNLNSNKNCNLTSWVSGCEPGWGCSISQEDKVNIKESQIIPTRILNCLPCCEGFFCPRGITCMIPCPLGAYCPIAVLNNSTGVCDPYNYQLPSGEPNHTCGGANIWADVGSSDEVFCQPGYYCPSTIKKIPCSSGFYCRKGSTSQTRCFQKSSCKAGSSNQDITIYGALLMGALILLLLVIYNFSGQILTSRERKQAKSREAAARHVRETAQAREKWKSAKDVAKKHVGDLQTQLSRTFSRKKTVKSETSKGSRLGSIDISGQNMPPGFMQTKKETGNLTKMVQSMDENPENQEGFNMEIGDKNLKKTLKAKQMHTRSQIFKYAYGQIEKEKAMDQENLTFSGVISMATDTEVRARLTIEVAFKDLTLTLKGSKKKLLKSVTGKFMPGRVAAIMGPSGAGKTTFLNALAGKATGCIMSGSIMINGKVEQLRSYKKIIGFVPQDDIVHGNLTVEENLWFSARCRLSADIAKADKVLVVERVIESLGLQPIRDSLVGTVEKRGISGGQRKRVNVGLEMVMEPSLLILDEPTSGLDSSSSRLLLQALRREALEGVNICMVVHQPSYTLFNMFDDLILLAKGGLTAYHGSVKKVEEYFSGLGINVPDRMNPPDYFIDILEGMVKPNTTTGVTYKDLPLRWMLHNGYDVPRDMLQVSTDVDGSVKGSNPSNSVPQETSSTRQIWDHVKDVVGHKKDEYEYNFSKPKDLSNRRTPGIRKQFRYYLGRVSKQRLREARIQGVDYLILCLAGVCLGTLAKVSDETFGVLGYTYTVIAVSLLCKIGALRSFSLEKLEYWRERASGMSSLAYFLARDTLDHFNTVIKPIVYLSMFYFFNNPRSSFWDNYCVLVALVYCVTGIGYVFAIFFQPGSAQLWSALVPVVLTLIATQQNTSKILSDLCYTKWALEAFVVANAQKYTGVWLATRCGALLENDYNIRDWGKCIGILIAYGSVCRCIAFICMITFQRR